MARPACSLRNKASRAHNHCKAAITLATALTGKGARRPRRPVPVLDLNALDNDSPRGVFLPTSFGLACVVLEFSVWALVVFFSSFRALVPTDVGRLLGSRSHVALNASDGAKVLTREEWTPDCVRSPVCVWLTREA